MSEQNKTVICATHGEAVPTSEVVNPALIFGGAKAVIDEQHPNLEDDAPVCQQCLNRMYATYVQRVLEERHTHLSELEMEVLESLENQEMLAENINTAFDREKTHFDQLSNNITRVVASWHFVVTILAIVALWVLMNVILRPFDPFPMITLAVISATLSTLAAIEAPIILMSQRRRAKYDRLRAENDYRVNLKAEIEVRHLHEKLDHLLTHQAEHMLHLQQIQLEMLEDLRQQIEIRQNGQNAPK